MGWSKRKATHFESLGAKLAVLGVIFLVNVSVFLDNTTLVVQPGPILEPVGSQIELNCKVSNGFRVEWVVIYRGGYYQSPLTLKSIGFETESSTARNRQPPLYFTGTVEKNQSTVFCEALSVTLRNFRYSCIGERFPVILYGKHSV